MVLGADISEHIFAAGCICLFVAAQCLRDALWAHGASLFERGGGSLLAAAKA